MQRYEKDKKRVNEVKKHLPNNPNPTQMQPPQTTLEPTPKHHQTNSQPPSASTIKKIPKATRRKPKETIEKP